MADQNSEFPEATSPRTRRTTRRVRRTEDEPVALADRQAESLDSGRKPAGEAESETPAPRKRRTRAARTTEETSAEPARSARNSSERSAADSDSSFGEGLLDDVPAAAPPRRPRRDSASRRASAAPEVQQPSAPEYSRDEPARFADRDEETGRESTPRRPARSSARDEVARPADDSRARDWFEHESLDFDSGATPRSTRGSEASESAERTRSESRPQSPNEGEESADYGSEGEGLRRRRRRRRGGERSNERGGQFDQPQFASSDDFVAEPQSDSERPEGDSIEGGRRFDGPRGQAPRNDSGRQEGYRGEGGRSDAYRQDTGRQDSGRDDSNRSDSVRNDGGRGEGAFDRSDSEGGRRRRRRRRRGRGGEGGGMQQGSAPQGGRRGHDNQQHSRHRGNRDQRGGRGSFQSQPQHRGDRNRGRSQQYDNDLGGEITGTIEGVLEIHPTKGFGFLRDPKKNYFAQDSDAFVSSTLIERYRLREGVLITGGGGPGSRGQGPRLKTVEKIDGRTPEEYLNIKSFDDLTPINPFEQIKLETGPKPVTMRVMDLLTPIGKGQRALIVAPPRSGKTMLLQDIADAVSQNHPELHLMVVLIDERPEEVTEMRRRVRGEVVASSMDRDVENHIRVSQLIFERAKRLVEAGGEVFILLDSVTRLARAFNKGINTGRTGTGGLDVRALDIPRKIFGTARRFDEGGSLTVVATALIDTGSRMDDSIFQEFKGTGNMELVLSRDLADRRIWPAMDISMSGTRREEKILSKEVLDGVTLLRRSLVSMNPTEAMEQLIRTLERFPSNKEFLARIRNVL